MPRHVGHDPTDGRRLVETGNDDKQIERVGVFVRGWVQLRHIE
jgi:hypothetical protein